MYQSMLNIIEIWWMDVSESESESQSNEWSIDNPYSKMNEN